MTTPVRPRRPFWVRLLLVLALLMPIIEIVVIVLVWKAIGWWTLLALLACFCAGVVVIKRASAGAVREVRQAMATGRPPAPEVADAPQLVVGGLLLLIPGFVTSLIGLILILPGMRSVSRRLLQLMIGRRVVAGVGMPGLGGMPGAGGMGGYSGRSRREDLDIIDGEIIEDDEPSRQGNGRWIIEGRIVGDDEPDDDDPRRRRR
ncbi:FxsA family protein [Flexivirga sp. ID2601S]|uniref:FxsA family protein n=1 Tax=Flexivirga aerilata TaxID=1656889 RepID=A0A849ALJ1_9MICO|nr:FxsA family protein [Flexivirga aerilata]NNG40973.1 FxsA family protein [Flexivirga aerilata]